MNALALDPLSAPAEWHRYLYRSVLLPWETSLGVRESYPRYSRKKLVAGVQINKVSTVQQVESAWAEVGDQLATQSSFTFVAEGQALKGLAGMLRNCTAHGHYTRVGSARICFQHKYKGKLKLFGLVKFSELKTLMTVICEGSS